MKFKVGELVKLNPRTRNYGADKGAIGICRGFATSGYGLCIDIEWIRTKEANLQNNGHYPEKDFECYDTENRIIKPYGIVNFIEKHYV